jgi:hypothetical protein
MSTFPGSDLRAQALALPENERVQLAGELLASVKPPGALSVDDADFLEVLSRRQQELRDGTAQTYSAEETLAAMREAIAQQRSE